METPKQYLISDGQAVYLNPIGEQTDPSLSENLDDEDYIDAVRYNRYKTWQQSEYASFTATSITNDGEPVKNWVYDCSEFGEPVEEFELDGKWHVFNPNTEQWFRLSGNPTRLTVYKI